MRISNCLCGKKPKIIPSKSFYESFGTGMIEVKCDCGCCVSVSRKDKPKYSFLRNLAVKVWNESCGEMKE